MNVNVKTSELRPGDVVLAHGMRCLIDGEINTTSGHRGPVYWTQALVLNRDEVPNERVPYSWTSEWKRNATRHEARPYNGEHRWTIQGNDLARWCIEPRQPGARNAPQSGEWADGDNGANLVGGRS